MVEPRVTKLSHYDLAKHEKTDGESWGVDVEVNSPARLTLQLFSGSLHSEWINIAKFPSSAWRTHHGTHS